MTTSVDNSSGEFFASMHVVADGRINKRHGDQEAKEGGMQI